MTRRIPVAKVGDMAPGQMRWVAAGMERLLLANVDGAFFSLSDECGHQRYSLARGILEGHEVECPLHFARFDVRTGKLVVGPSSENLPTYHVLVEGDTVYVEM